LVGSVAPLAVSFISTPFVIRFLGTESYGLLLLVGLIPTYLMFADFGMGVASTKFASEAFGRGDEKKEAEIVWAATARSLHICPPSRSFVSFRVAPFVSFKTKSMTYGRLISA
ncbi:MAG: hypothetical protein PSX80_17600, partial [bacterium]|nr:hypothetical protein [bacterium]